MVQELSDVVGTHVLVIQVVSMLPHILINATGVSYGCMCQSRNPATYHGEDGLDGLVSQRGISVGSLGDNQTVGGPHKPSPSRAEGGVASILELGAEVLIRTERGVDQVSNTASGGSSTTRLHALPVKIVVPGLRRIVEETLVTRSLCSTDDADDISVLQISTSDCRKTSFYHE